LHDPIDHATVSNHDFRINVWRVDLERTRHDCREKHLRVDTGPVVVRVPARGSLGALRHLEFNCPPAPIMSCQIRQQPGLRSYGGQLTLGRVSRQRRCSREQAPNANSKKSLPSLSAILE